MQKYFLIILLFFVPINAIIEQKVIICGVCKDVQYYLPHTINIIEKIGNLFSDYRVIVYENNSSDKTPQLLKNWQEKNNKVLAITEKIPRQTLQKLIINRLQDNSFFKPECIARARNIVLDIAMSKNYEDFDYLIWLDMDFIREPKYSGFIETFERESEWDAVFAYGVGIYNEYWDWYALRDSKIPLGAELLSDDWWQIPRNLVLKQTDDWYPVYSAFGGCGIYKKSSLKGCRYSALVTPDLAKFYEYILEKESSHALIKEYFYKMQKLESTIFINQFLNLSEIKNPKIGIVTENLASSIVWRMNSFVYRYPSVCEHVPFHASMIVNGYNKLFINPRLIFRYGT